MTFLLGVYRDRRDAEATARDLEQRAGVDGARVHVGERTDLELAIRAEMDAEVAESVGSPGLGAFMTKEMARGAFVFAMALGGIGLVVGAALGFVFAGPTSWSWTERVLLGAVIGASFFGTVGTLLGGGLAMKSPEDRLAAERGVTLRCDHASEDVLHVMADHQPIRLDLLAGQQRLATPLTETASGMAEMADEFARNVRDPRRQG